MVMLYEFEDFTLDADRQELRVGADAVRIEPRVLDLLFYLIRNRERTVGKDDLIANVWNGRIVSDSTLTSRIALARRAINDSGEAQRLIRTVSRKGVRFVGEVRERIGNRAPGAPQESANSQASALELLFGTATPRLPGRPSIAVLPFTNMSDDPAQEYFSDGVTEDIITALSRLRWFFVIARNSSFAYKGGSVDVREIGRDLGVRYVLEGSVRKSGQRVRIAAQLIDAATGNHIWAEYHDRELVDVFALQDEIAATVAAAIEPQLMAAEGFRSETRPVGDLDAWDLVARAVARLWKLTPADSAAAIAILEQAVKHHPNYAPPHSLLAFGLLVAGHMGWRASASDRAAAESLALRAVELDESDPWAYMALGYLAFTARQTDEATRRFFTATDLNPNFAAAYGYAGWAMAHADRSDEAIENLKRAIRMSPRDPLNVFYMAGLAAAHYVAGRYSEATRWAQEALRLRPEHLGARRKLCASLAQAGLVAEAEAEMTRLRELQPTLSLAWIRQSVPYTPGPMERFLDGMRKAGLTE
ncbi:MAG TPA: winged helix-turn-helix domain-containing tetratricopeptide repeat protein [Rhodocyclaceae bacterium]|nr:winged helix-turn-helix domain-containing tetratricopeptide repeat protein [Rhodocyclaceae bacterium]HRQ47053.1 winged helix-turn-helix domain-containing tetratricopeptide repeat protein [Rhodocyclaceae bacterium]